MEEVGLGVKPSDLDLEDAAGRESVRSDDVEFKIVDDERMDEEMPLFEIVKQSVDDSEPLEMDLLEKEAVEFELLENDEDGISEDALEVEPIEVEELDEGIDVEAIEVDIIEDDEGEVQAAPKPKPKTKPKPKIKAKGKKKPAAAKKGRAPKPAVSPAAQPAVHTKPVTATSPAPPPTPAAASGTATDEPLMEFSEIFEGMSPEEIQAIEDQLIKTSSCSLCGAGLSNPNFCTQCGAKVVMTQSGVKTVSRDAPAQSQPAPKTKTPGKRKAVAKKK
jgi:hypothetical protein